MHVCRPGSRSRQRAIYRPQLACLGYHRAIDSELCALLVQEAVWAAPEPPVIRPGLLLTWRDVKRRGWVGNAAVECALRRLAHVGAAVGGGLRVPGISAGRGESAHLNHGHGQLLIPVLVSSLQLLQHADS
jgi:hypothetical protein